MSDIIANAKRLLEGATPGPWEWVGYDIGQTTEAGGGMVMDVICDNPHSGWIEPVEIAPDDEALIAAAPELAQALAEESWEYAVQFKNEESGKWYTNGFYGIGMHGQKWFASKDEAERQIERSYPVDLVEPREYRLVRRRVSPPEVCE